MFFAEFWSTNEYSADNSKRIHLPYPGVYALKFQIHITRHICFDPERYALWRHVNTWVDVRCSWKQTGCVAGLCGPFVDCCTIYSWFGRPAAACNGIAEPAAIAGCWITNNCPPWCPLTGINCNCCGCCPPAVCVAIGIICTCNWIILLYSDTTLKGVQTQKKLCILRYLVPLLLHRT